MNPQMNQDQQVSLPMQPSVPQTDTVVPVLPPSVPVYSVDSASSATGAIQQPSQVSNVMPDAAADVDLIEKEWLAKAKQVIHETRNDPYSQVLELNKVKVDYMKKRYDKELKLAED